MPKKLATYVPAHRRGVKPANGKNARFYAGVAWAKARTAVLNRDLWQCQYCGVDLRGLDATVDHVKPLHLGGERLDPSNLKASCRSCNSSRARLQQQGKL